MLGKDSESKTAHLTVCSKDQQGWGLRIYSEPCKQSIAAYVKNRQFFVLITRQLRGWYDASTKEGRDITMQSYLEHSRRRICNAVNVDFLAEIARQTKATKFAANRFEEYSPQYLLYIWASSLSKKQQNLSKTGKLGLCNSNILSTIADSLAPHWWTVSTRTCWILRKSSLSGRIGTSIWLGEKVRSGRLWSSDPKLYRCQGWDIENKGRKAQKEYISLYDAICSCHLLMCMICHQINYLSSTLSLKSSNKEQIVARCFL